MSIHVTSTAPSDWDAYVERHPSASAYHRARAVSIGAEAFGLPTIYVAARGHGGELKGVLPLVEQSSFAFGKFLSSVPFFTYGGLLSDDDGTTAAIADAAVDIAKSRRVDHLELRHTFPLLPRAFSVRTDKLSMVLKLPESVEALSKQLGSKLRSQIKRAEREQPEVEWGGEKLLDEFYSVFSVCMHELGTPVYPRRFFTSVHDALRDDMSVLVVRLQGRAQAAAIVVRHPTSVEVPWAACLPEAKKVALNMRMYWEMLSWSVQKGANAFDFGRSSQDSGTYRFKAQWGAEPTQLYWHYWIRKGGSPPVLNHSNPKYALAGTVWRRMPRWFVNTLGPYIARNLP